MYYLILLILPFLFFACGGGGNGSWQNAYSGENSERSILDAVEEKCSENPFLAGCEIDFDGQSFSVAGEFSLDEMMDDVDDPFDPEDPVDPPIDPPVIVKINEPSNLGLLLGLSLFGLPAFKRNRTS